MFLVSVIPAAKISLPAPQILTYFTTHELLMGSLVLIPLHKKTAIGVVVETRNLSDQKMALRRADFELRGVAKILTPFPALDEKQLQLAQWIHQYYWCPLGATIKMMLPEKIQNQRISARGGSDFGKKSRDYNLKTESRDKTKQKLILVPEINLIDKIARQHRANDTSLLHSQLTDKQYFENWLRIKNNGAKTIIGTRIALFAPFVDLKEIIVEEEHSPSYKAQQTPRFHARETVLTLAKLWGAKIIFKSSTPSIETAWLAKNKKITLQLSAASDRQLTTIVVDLRNELKKGNFSIFSRELQEELKNIISKKKQAVLFINRRGVSGALLCRECGYISKCKNCDAPLIYHLQPPRLICHHCGYSEEPPTLCPNCHGAKIKFLSAGTQKAEAEFKKLFPNTTISRIDSDVAKDEKIASEIIENFNNGKTPVLVGTQILFSGALKKVPLAAMIIADTLFHLPDFRSNEKTFQIINQLKELTEKKLIVQTYSPQNGAIRTATEGNYEIFYEEEVKDRQLLSYPPFSQLIKLTYKHKNNKQAEQQAKILAGKIKQQLLNLKLSPLITILGPSPAFIQKIKNQYIWQIILKSRVDDLNTRNKILQIIPPGWIIDVDPISLTN
ncbi:MAG: primosomal protein N' [Candidatus Portnoybacteria bacterium]|nr:primosomal protein N' [Candidatus Portnoybacteria bacterium]